MTFDPNPWPNPASATGAPPPAEPVDAGPPTSSAPLAAPAPPVAAPFAAPAPLAAPAPAKADAPRPVPPPARPPHTAGGILLVLGAAILSATLASAGTAAILLATRPAASPAPAAIPSASAVAAASPATSPAAGTVTTRIDGADAVTAVAAATAPSVVTISGSNGRFGATSGTGIVVSADGLILTTVIVAPFDGTYDILLADLHESTGDVVATDAEHGLVLLRAGATGLTPARLAGGGSLAVGQLVVAVGSPLGEFTDTVTSGIVSGLDRSIDTREPVSGARVALGGLIQTDAAINAGSSGGPLIDANGTVVGVIALAASNGQGIGFAIPISDALDLIARADR